MAEREDQYVPDATLASFSCATNAALTFTDEAHPFIAWLARRFPDIKRRALGKAGSTVRGWGRAALESKAEPGTSWRRTSSWEMRRRRVSDPKRSRHGAGQREALAEKFFAGRRGGERPYGKMYSTSRYILSGDGSRVDVGWVTYDAAHFGRAVQAGLRGGNPYFPKFAGEQPVTARMRRALAASGLVLSRGKVFLGQPERPLWVPLFSRAQRELPGVIENYMAEKVGGARWDRKRFAA